MHPIKRQRAIQRLSLRELARRSGVPAGALSSIERGQREPQIVTLAKIADALGVDVEELLEAPKKGPAPLPEDKEQRRARSPWVRYVEQRIDWYEDLFRRPPGEFVAPLSSLDTAIQFAVSVGTDLARIKDTVRELAALDPDTEEVRELVELSDRFGRVEERVAARVSEMARAERSEEEGEAIRLRLIDGARSA